MNYARYDKSFFDSSKSGNYYAQNVSEYTKEIFNEAGLSEYIAGYMWGTTGFVFNPHEIGKDVNEAREIMKSWNSLYSASLKNKITAKDNARDSYFMGLGMLYENELLQLREKYNNGEIDKATYKATLSQKMNDTGKATTNKVKDLLKKTARLSSVGVVGLPVQVENGLYNCAVLFQKGKILGVVPTPAVAYLVSKYKADAGIMISASHNPYEFNGIKLFVGCNFIADDYIWRKRTQTYHNTFAFRICRKQIAVYSQIILGYA